MEQWLADLFIEDPYPPVCTGFDTVTLPGEEGLTMPPDQVKCLVQIITTIMARVARKTATLADDLIVSVLESNQDRIAEAALRLLPRDGCELPSEAQITIALRDVGIRV